MNANSDPVPSPCIRNCCLDTKDICMGCYRHINEILRWGSATDAEKLQILELVAERSK